MLNFGSGNFIFSDMYCYYWNYASQFHPEFTSNPRDGHPLFKSFIAAVRQHAEGELPKAAEA